MARTTAYHMCAAIAMFLAIFCSSLLYAHQRSSGDGVASPPSLVFDKAIAPRDGIEVPPQSLDAIVLNDPEPLAVRDKIVNSDSELTAVLLKPQEKVSIPSEYKTSVKKGELLLCYMKGEASPGSKDTSAWQSLSQLDLWGWKREVDEADDVKDYSHVVGKCTREIRLQEIINSDLTGGKQRKWVHYAESTDGGITYYYKNQHWPDAGILMADSNYGAEYMIVKGKASKNPWVGLPLPKLKQWQDLTSPSQRQNLRWIFRRNIMNEETQSLISRVIENRGDNVLWHIVPNPFKLYEAPTWPGMLLKEGDEGFAALSGSPNVAGLCWLLIQHQGAEQLGKKTVKSIRVWKDDSGAYAPHILIEVGSVEWPHPKGPEASSSV
ncbi:hypothetical protein CLAFUW4_02075 [Fulvia fulva]|nr:hypothetical protein CLAFUR4_02071 [Fulvia fulva]WPV09209.1 hypothetical protein CLAFUW4_02075 [Fulvia fulva]WPV23182.1 hypothetical protein CLAFUW7_02075 [Fulvia fulva]